jgi:hypothetical protein
VLLLNIGGGFGGEGSRQSPREPALSYRSQSSPNVCAWATDLNSC